jgi:hypothetical protein
MYEAQKLLCALKMTYEQIHACPKGCVLFRKEHTEAKYCPKCKSSRFMEVDSGDGQMRQLDIPVTILRHLLFIPRIQRLYMTEESAKQMTWHKKGKRYNPDKMVHASDGQAWTHFDAIHHEKAKEARNVRVALARWVQSLWNDRCPIHMLARVRYPHQSPPRCMLSKTEHIHVVDNSWTPGVGVSRPGGPSGRRVSVAACPSPDGSSAWASSKGGRSEAAGDRRERGGNPAAFVFVPRPGRVRLQ